MNSISSTFGGSNHRNSGGGVDGTFGSALIWTGVRKDAGAGTDARIARVFRCGEFKSANKKN